MTAIAALVDNGRVWMAGDSAGVTGYGLTVRKDAKVFRNGEFLIGFTDSFRMGQLLRFHLVPPKPNEGDTDPLEFMVTKFVPEIRTLLKEYGYAKTDNNREEAGEFLVGWRGNLFTICEDYQVGVNANLFAATGCGQDVALGSLYSTDGQEPQKRLALAMQAAEQFSAGVRGPFIYLNDGATND